MITALSMNPAIDRTLRVPRFEVGGTNRVAACRDEGAGKAVNVALAAKALGASARCVGLLPEAGGELVERRLEGAGVGFEFIRTPGAVRVNMKLVDESSGVVTELNQTGARVPAEMLDALGALCVQAADGGFLVMTGSLPPGAEPSYYAQLASMVGGACRVALDAEGEPFRLALDSKPFLVKPNRMELELALDRRLSSLAEVVDGARELVSRGIELALVTLGADGTLLVSHNEALFAPGLRLDVTSTVGAGDSSLAGALAALETGLQPQDVLRTAAAAAAASVIRRGSAIIDRSDFEDCKDKIKVQRL